MKPENLVPDIYPDAVSIDSPVANTPAIQHADVRRRTVDITTKKLIIFDADGTLRRCTVPGQPCPNKDGEWELMRDGDVAAREGGTDGGAGEDHGVRVPASREGSAKQRHLRRLFLRAEAVRREPQPLAVLVGAAVALVGVAALQKSSAVPLHLAPPEVH